MIKPVSGIYMWENIKTGKVYIGSSSNIRLRYNVHVSRLKQGNHWNSYLQNSWNIHSLNSFKFTIIENCIEANLLIREQYWMNFYKSFNRNFGYNVNSIAGRTTGYRHTKESKEKIRLANKQREYKPASEKERKRLGSLQLGVKQSDATKLKKSLSMMGKLIGYKHSKQTKRNMSIAHLGHKRHTQASKQKISLANIGRNHTKETRKKMSLSCKGRLLSKKTKRKISLTKLGVKRTKEACRNVSLGMLKMYKERRNN